MDIPLSSTGDIVSMQNLVWLLTLAPLAVAAAYGLILVHELRERKRLMRIIDRYATVRVATNEFMSVAISFLNSPLLVLAEGIEKMRSLNLVQAESLQDLQANITTFATSVKQAQGDNEASAARTETRDQIPTGQAPRLFSGVGLWLPVLSILMLYGGGRVLLGKPVNSADLLGGIILLSGITCLIFTYRQLGRVRSSRTRTERQAALTADLFSLRRVFMQDTLQTYRAQSKLLASSCQPLRGIPQARSIFKGLSWLEAICNRLERAYDASQLTEEPPLFAVSAFLTKAVEHEYTTLAASGHISVQTDIANGLAFRISPADFTQLMNSIVDNAVTYSKPGSQISIRGRRRAHKVIITVSDHGVGISDQQISSLFQPQAQSKQEAVPPSLNLHINKIIMARVGGELKISSQQGEGTIVTIIGYKTRTRDDFTVPLHILRSTSALT